MTSLQISASPEHILCGGTAQIYVSSVHLFETITLVFPDNSTQTAQAPLILTYTAKDDDCGKTVTFSATGNLSNGASASVDVIKAEFESLTTAGGTTEYLADEENKNHSRLAVIVDVTAKIKLTPKPDSIPPNFKVQIVQWVNGHSGWLYLPNDNAPLDSTDQLIGEDKPPELEKIEDDSYDSTTGIITFKCNDSPGRSVGASTQSRVGSVRADLKAADYLQIKSDNNSWKTLGKLEWHWIGGVYFQPSNGPYGGFAPASGSEFTGSPSTPSNP